jgi:hypothetical protein
VSLKLRIASDLHLEFWSDRAPAFAHHFLPPDEQDADSVLVLAGDISSSIGQLVSFLREVTPRFRRTIYVPGNHEYYRSHYDDWNKRFLAAMLGVHGVWTAVDQMDVLDYGGVRFIYGTLWGDGGDTEQEQNGVDGYLADFKVIGFGIGRFSVPDMQGLHLRQKEQLRKALEAATTPAVIITHHMPSYALSHPRFGDVATGGFAGKCDDLMTGPKAPQLWIHGHTHDSIDRVIGSTRIVCNPAGYKPEWGTAHNQFFERPMFVEVAPSPSGQG